MQASHDTLTAAGRLWEISTDGVFLSPDGGGDGGRDVGPAARHMSCPTTGNPA